MARASYGHENRNAALREVLLSEPVSRNEIADRIGLTEAAVSRIARSLMDARLVREHVQEPDGGPGRTRRRQRPLTVDPQGGQVLGIAILPTIQIVVLSDLGRNVIASAEFSFDPIEDAERAVRHVAQECRALIGANLRDRSRLFGGLLLITADVDSATGNVRQADYLGWDDFPLRARMAELLRLPMRVGVATLAVGRAETLFGAARGRRNPLALMCGAGIGVAVLVDGHPAGDTSYPTGGIGRMTVTGEGRHQGETRRGRGRRRYRTAPSWRPRGGSVAVARRTLDAGRCRARPGGRSSGRDGHGEGRPRTGTHRGAACVFREAGCRTDRRRACVGPVLHGQFPANPCREQEASDRGRRQPHNGRGGRPLGLQLPGGLRIPHRIVRRRPP